MQIVPQDKLANRTNVWSNNPPAVVTKNVNWVRSAQALNVSRVAELPTIVLAEPLAKVENVAPLNVPVTRIAELARSAKATSVQPVVVAMWTAEREAFVRVANAKKRVVPRNLVVRVNTVTQLPALAKAVAQPIHTVAKERSVRKTPVSMVVVRIWTVNQATYVRPTFV